MKCPRCKHDMRRTKTARGYHYVCSNCKFVVGANTARTTQDSRSVAGDSSTSENKGE